MKYRVEFTIDIDESIANETQVSEWLRFELGCSASLSCENPLCDDYDIEATSIRIRRD